MELLSTENVTNALSILTKAAENDGEEIVNTSSDRNKYSDNENDLQCPDF